MKKKLLSLLLVLCMVLPMVPVAVIPAMAAAKAPAVTLYHADGSVFTTLDGQHGDMVRLPAYTGTPDGKIFIGWDMTGDGKADHNDGATVIIPTRTLELVPVFEDEVVIEEKPFVAGKTPFAGNEPVVSGSTVTWRSGWQVGFYNSNTFTPYKAQSGGINLHNGDPWGGQGGMYNSGSSYKLAMTKAPNYTTILYTMPFTATIEVGYDKLISRRETNAGDVAATVALDVAIYVNNVKVWPTDKEWYHYEGTTVYPAGKNEYNENALEAMKKAGVANANGVVATIPVNCGDVVSFRASRGNSTTWMLYEQPFVNAISNVGPEKPATTITTAFSDNFPYYVADATKFPSGSSVLFKGNWSWITYPAATYGEAILLDTIFPGNHGSTNPWGDPFVEPAGSTGLGSYGYPNVRVNAWNSWWGSVGAITVRNGYNAGLRYIAEYDGKISIDITKLGVGTDADTLYGVFVNGQMVWPNVGDYYTTDSKWHNPDAAPGSATVLTDVSGVEATGIYVNAGDAVELLMKSYSGGSRHNEVDMKVIYNTVYGGDTLLVSVEDAATRVETKKEYQNGATFTLPTYSPIPDDFLGWDANGDGAVDYEMGDEVTVTTNLSLKPVFKTYEKYSELVFKGTNWPVTHASSSIKPGNNGAYVMDKDFAGGWKAVSYDYGKIMNMAFVSQWDSFEYNSWGGGILWPDSGAICRINMTDLNSQGVGYTYTVPYTGVIRLETSFATPAAKAVASGGCDAVYFSILKLAADGTATTVVDTIEYTDTAIKTVTAKHVSANAGDTILYLYRVKTTRTKANDCPGFSSNFNASVSYESTIDPENTIFVSYAHPATGRPVMMDATKGGSFVLPAFPDGYVFFGWDLNGDNVVDYKPGTTITLADENVEIKPVLAAASSLKDNLPTYDALNMNVNYHGGWQVGVYDKYGEQFMPYTTYNPTYKLFSNYKDAWLKWGGYYVDGDWPRFAMSTGSMAGAEMWSTIQYTTPMAGEISIDIKDIWGNEKGTPATPLSIKFAIYKNGEKIWPAGDEWALVERADSGNLMASLRANYPNAFPIKTTVNVGDKIEFRAEKQNAASHMFGMDPSISYTALNAAPKVTATGVTVKDTFTLNVYTYFGSVRTDFLSTGLKVWTSYNAAANLDNSYAAPNAFSYVNNTVEGALVTDVTAAYAIQNIAVQNMSRKFYVRTYVEYADGIVYGDVVEISVEQYAMNAVKSASEESALKRVAAALLKYNAAVNAYYGIQSDIVVPEKLPVLPEITPENSFNMTEFENNAIVGATLDIKDTVNMVIYIDTDENISGWRLQMDDNASFTTPSKYKLVKIDERLGGGYYVTVELKLSEYNTDFYFRIVDELGEAHSGVLTYSVETYVARKIEQEPENEKLINMLKSMLVLCKTANDAR